MKKSILIIMLCALQSACVHYTPADLTASPLLSFEELGSEITVTRIIEQDDAEPIMVSDAS